MSGVVAALVADLRRKLEAGWTLSVEGRHVAAVAAGTPDHKTVIACASEEAAAALLAAAEASG